MKNENKTGIARKKKGQRARYRPTKRGISSVAAEIGKYRKNFRRAQLCTHIFDACFGCRNCWSFDPLQKTTQSEATRKTIRGRGEGCCRFRLATVPRALCLRARVSPGRIFVQILLTLRHVLLVIFMVNSETIHREYVVIAVFRAAGEHLLCRAHNEALRGRNYERGVSVDEFSSRRILPTFWRVNMTKSSLRTSISTYGVSWQQSENLS